MAIALELRDAIWEIPRELIDFYLDIYGRIACSTLLVIITF